MLSKEEFITWYRRLGLSQQAVSIIERIRNSPPARSVQGGSQNVCGRYPSGKMGKTIDFESHRVELPVISEMEYDDDVLEFYSQPASEVKLKYEKNGRNIGVRHIADLFALRMGSAGWEECKTEEELLRLAVEDPKRYCYDDELGWRCPPGEEYAKQFGLYYRVRSSKKINWNQQRNIQFLEDYYRSNRQVEETTKQPLLAQVRNRPGITLLELINSKIGSPDDIYQLIASNELFVDLLKHLLVEPDRTPVFANIQASNGWALVVQSEARLPTTVNMNPGCTLEWDGKGWKILNVGEGSIFLEDLEGNSIVPVSTKNFEALAKSGALKPIIMEGAALPQTHPFVIEAFRNANANDLREANRRHEMLRHFLSGEKPTGVSARTLRRWAADCKAAEIQFGCGFVGLLPDYKGRGNRDPKLPVEVQGLIKHFIETDFKTIKHKRAQSVHSSLVAACEEKGFIAPSYKTFLKAIQKEGAHALAVKREGWRGAYKYEVHYRQLEMTTPKHGDRPFEICHIDHTELDVELVCSLTGRNLGRPWLTIMTDAYSRRFVAQYLSFNPPSYRSCMMVIRDCVRRHGRLPQIIVVDWGPEFESIYFTTLLARYEVLKKSRPKAKARFGSVCERLFGTTNTRFIHNLQGNTQIMKRVRLAYKLINPKELAVWTLEALNEALCYFAFELNDTIKHPALGATPREVFVEGMLRGGTREFRIVPYDEAFLMLTMPSTPRQLAKVVPGKGVKINNIYYWCAAFLDPLVENTKVEVRFDPEDIGRVFSFVKGRWTECQSEFFSVFQGRTQKELQFVTQELRKRLRQSHQDLTITARKLAAFFKTIENQEEFLTLRLKEIANRSLNGTVAPAAALPETSKLALSAPEADEIEQSQDEENTTENLEVYEEF
jgi:transposase InsO family protein